MKTLTIVIIFGHLCLALSGGDRFIKPLKLKQNGGQMFVFEEETEAIEEATTEQIELITLAKESEDAKVYAPTCNNAPYYGKDSCTLDCPISGWKLELDTAGCCCFYFETEVQDDSDLVYSEEF